MTAAPPILQLSAADYRYPRAEAPTLTGISLDLPAGAHLGIVGESGAGKSTLLSLLLGLTSPTRGAVLFDGQPRPSGSQRVLRSFRRSVQMVFQDPYSSLDPRQTVGSIVGEPLRSLRVGDTSERSRMVAEALDSVGLPGNAAGRYPHEFSGGQRQRIAIARAIAPRPRLLLADEPVSALDVTTRVSVLDLLRTLGEERGLAVVMVSHDLSAVAALCHSAVVLQAGQIVERGSTASILGNPRHPYTQKLVSSVPRLPAL
ncbi:hypothetical protein GCM10022198_12310 [Klugiella xanthotipulae]|uniref:Peptide/nickel transport system ATP-binding protein n=1 Tax=Klugiella xanthotipulae TaxID=244735 RepID=A0A543I406_9MICO|nr:ATP-binding cassette domain-containing protein [Klugiella xanthotipulae]TQM65318.1 peptide/nickel transport system ATP-binding protein [Klugiella xanthotipulae]